MKQQRRITLQKSQCGRWTRRFIVVVLMGLCFGSLVVMQTQYSGIKILMSLQPPNNQRFSKTPKIAFLFIARNRLSLDVVWDQFFKGARELRFSVSVHSRPGFLFSKATTRSAYFYGRQLKDSIQVEVYDKPTEYVGKVSNRVVLMVATSLVPYCHIE
ncbi:hypothetical protein GIB67_030715 [Kingdonia uniflora]|uniref:Core-2/I-branching beta-1,6-N-acetylglucosaminyltransferase family protein n=1 Tax=Kingdonia uniflora TaxID=39325 RepID=A0A7J7L2U0_9MAGN|nr:hypothetical protein GIB67_030715 [Kingdonia uniflora]